MDKTIRSKFDDNLGFVLDDDERERWILNDEGLYNWARSQGVDV